MDVLYMCIKFDDDIHYVQKNTKRQIHAFSILNSIYIVHRFQNHDSIFFVVLTVMCAIFKVYTYGVDIRMNVCDFFRK